MPLTAKEKIKYLAHMVTIEKYEQGYVFSISLGNKEKQQIKMMIKILKQIQKLKIDTVVFSDRLIENSIWYSKIEENLQKQGIEIINGRKLMQYINFDIFQYILNLQKREMQQEDIYILIQKDLHLDVQFLSRFIENCRTVNIVTNDLPRFKKIQDNLYEKENILISVSNNKSKSLKKAKYIFNINMETKEIEKFKINRNAIIINFNEMVKYAPCTFDGINVNGIQIDMPDEYIEIFETMKIFHQFEPVKLYESILIRKIEQEKKKRINIVTDLLKEDDIKIRALIGNKGAISATEIMKLDEKS